MKTDGLDRLRAISPGRQDAQNLVSEAERQSIFASAIAADRERRPFARRRLAPAAAWVIPVTAAGALAAAITLPSLHPTTVPSVATGHGHVTGNSHMTSKPQARTVAYVTRRIEAALADEKRGTLVDTLTSGGQVTKVVEDLSSGASRFTTSESSDGSIVEDDSSTGGRHPTSTFVDYGIQAWWTEQVPLADYARSTNNPHILRQWLADGVAVVAGEGVVNGQQAIHLHIPSQIFTQNGKQYGVSITDVWVSATTFLPLREVGIDASWTEDLAWSAQPPSPAEVTAVPPAGFTHLAGPPPSGDR